MEGLSIVSKYVYEKSADGLKGGYPLIPAASLPMQSGGATQYGHLAIPVGIVVVREYSVPMAHYDTPVSDGCVDDELFETMLQKVGHREHSIANTTKKNKDESAKKSKKKHHKS